MMVLKLGLVLLVAAGAFGQELPEGQGKAEFVQDCTTCHRADTVTHNRKTAEDWKKSVADMVGRGAPGTDKDHENVVAYLAAHFGVEQAAPEQAVATKADADAATAAIAENGCVICHRIEKQGGYIGPSLNGVGKRKTVAGIREAIVHPPAKVAPGNVIVSATTADGKTVAGRLVGQDEKNVRVIDMAGVVSTYAKGDLKGFTTVDTNPMPSYEKRIAPEDLDGLARYLSSLPVVDEGK